ncbi:MAG TPA: DNA translocase FtsK 4TM domain-containing protein [Vicinamibacterales bacterium]|nr:DNA translocase FtsK 4TM domain-containing protein [Vicinamibacterales bacterium]
MGGSTVSRRVSEFVGVALFAAALIWIISLASYEPADPVWFFSAGAHGAPANFAGRVGAFLAELSFQLFGYAAYVVPAAMVIIGWNYFWCRSLDAAVTKATGASLLFACISAFLSLIFGTLDVSGKSFRAGGYVGEFLANEMSDYLNRTGSIIVILTLIFLGIIMSTQFSFGRFFGAIGGSVKDATRRGIEALNERREERRREKQRRDVIAKHTKKAAAADAPPPKVQAPLPPIMAEAAAPAPAAKPVKKRITDTVARAFRRTTDDEDDAPEPAAAAAPAGIGIGKSFAPPKPPKLNLPASTLPLSDPEPTSKAPAERRKGAYTLPPLALLDASKAERKIDERELMDGARLLEEKCREFSVEGSVVQIHPGPVVTTFEFKPDAGVKYAKITGLAEDLCLAMQADSVLIDRIPGKSTVGIQIPNHTREQISLRELLESEAYKRSTSKLTIALGKTIHGEPYMADLATMPHLLIAGSTGAGKSVSMNSMLTSILYRATPDDVRLIMIDPKRLELGMYEDIPHLMTPVVVDSKQAANALRWAVREMEERYKTLAAVGVRNIEQYNRNMQAAIAAGEKPEEGKELKLLPFIIVVIDELADLMMVASSEVEESIARLAQMARAVGIHLILATQRPSVDVITGLIKANLPSRIAIRVASKIDSRTILDGNGAEQLLGKGDMLFLPPASSRFIRVHAAYISEQETARLASFLRKQGKPVYDETITAEEKTAADGLEFEKDDLYDEAARIVVSSGQASISYLQRRLRIGFSRAARLVDMMEMEGLVSPAAGGKPREVLVDKGYFEEVDAQLR